jgi:hypothetical protein
MPTRRRYEAHYPVTDENIKFIKQSNLVMLILTQDRLVRNWAMDLPFYPSREIDGERDLAGKLPWAMKMLSLDLDNHCIIDPSNSGGILKFNGASTDAIFVHSNDQLKTFLRNGKGKLIEIKGAVKPLRGNACKFNFRPNGFKNKENTTVVFMMRDNNPIKMQYGQTWLDLDMDTMQTNIRIVMIPMARLYQIITERGAYPSAGNSNRQNTTGPWPFTVPFDCNIGSNHGQIPRKIMQSAVFKGSFAELTKEKLQELGFVPSVIDEDYSHMPGWQGRQSVEPSRYVLETPMTLPSKNCLRRRRRRAKKALHQAQLLDHVSCPSHL